MPASREERNFSRTRLLGRRRACPTSSSIDDAIELAADSALRRIDAQAMCMRNFACDASPRQSASSELRVVATRSGSGQDRRLPRPMIREVAEHRVPQAVRLRSTEEVLAEARRLLDAGGSRGGREWRPLAEQLV